PDVLSQQHLASSSRSCLRDSALSRYVAALQTQQPDVALSDPAPADFARLETTCGNHADPSPAVSQAVGGRIVEHLPSIRRGCFGRRLSTRARTMGLATDHC